MLEFTSKPKTLDFKVDGKVKHLPLSIGLDEYDEMGEAADSGETIKMLRWFHDYIVGQCGKDCEKFGDAELNAVMAEWNAARSEIGEADEGER